MKSQVRKKAPAEPRKPRIVGGVPTGIHRKRRVYVGMSGGVDSSVSAALLKKAGYDVTGVFIKVWQPDWLECTWKEDRRDAMRVAAHLDIPFTTLDLEKEYKKDVVDYMIAEYRAGRTPNPDVMCNKSVKFGAFYDWAMKNGADYVATGHYAQVIRTAKTKKGDSLGALLYPIGTFNIHISEDSNKDQSYFIYHIQQQQLPHILFPIGHLKKPEVRALARRFQLPNADKKDSQGLCFIGHVDMKDFLSHYIETKPGVVLDITGKQIGVHPGALYFTNGERHGFTITAKTPHDAAYFVVAKDMKANTITVSQHLVSPQKIQKTKKLRAVVTRINIKHTNWINVIPDQNAKLKARIRYRQSSERCTIISASLHEAEIEYVGLAETISPGQSMVLYDNDICIGGGIIDSVNSIQN